MEYICSLVIVEDIEKARKFYEEILEQKVSVDYGENITFEGGFSLHQKEHFKELIDHKPIIRKTNNFELYFEHDAIESFVDKLKANNIELVHELKKQPWQQRVIRFYDYDHNMIEVGESMAFVAYRLFKEGYTTERIYEITYMPEDVIEKAIEKYSEGLSN
jgi:catechol 2,3-dioxygenase-like lactoylglutathione lyase family enzyme